MTTQRQSESQTRNELLSVGSPWHTLYAARKRSQWTRADKGSRVRQKGTSVISALLLIMLVIVQAGIGVHAETIQNVTYYHSNIQGTPIAATDEQGNVLWEQEYSPYGLPRGSASQQSAAALNTVDFTGHVRDKDAGASLVYMGARHYDPVLGRFLSMDPVQPLDGVPESVNRYAYANNNPYRYVDPDGELPVLIIAYWAAVSALTAYDTYTAYQRDGVGEAVVQMVTDAALSAVGGVAIAKALKAGSRVAKTVKYRINVKDVRAPGANKPNYQVDKTKQQFEDHLSGNGFDSSVIDSPKGPITVFSKNGQKEFTTRNFSRSTDGPSGEMFKGDKMSAKIRFKWDD